MSVAKKSTTESQTIDTTVDALTFMLSSAKLKWADKVFLRKTILGENEAAVIRERVNESYTIQYHAHLMERMHIFMSSLVNQLIENVLEPKNKGEIKKTIQLITLIHIYLFGTYPSEETTNTLDGTEAYFIWPINNWLSIINNDT